MKKLLLIVVDSLSSRVLMPAMQEGKLPNLQALAQAGSLDPDCSTIFPSITHAATASIATGRYPSEHGIAGAYWFDTDGDEVVYYSSDFWVILNEGFDEFFEGFVVKLNHKWLQAKTLFQLVEQAGLTAACINYVIFRGDVVHRLDVPRLLTLLPGVPFSETVLGPTILCMGDFVKAIPQAAEQPTQASGGLLHRFGFEDDYTADTLIQLAKADLLPDFTLAYFPDNDDRSHQVGPDAAKTTLEHLDNRLGELFEVYGGLESVLQDLCIILTGDHSQSDVLADEEEASIRLDEILVDFSLAQVGKPWGVEEQLLICPNLRMAQIYFRQPVRPHVEAIIKQLLSEAQIDQVMWRANLLDELGQGYHVATADRGALHFWPGTDGPHTAMDQQGCRWSWEGPLDPVGGQVSADDTLTFPDYPNALERIAGGLECPNGGHLWVTARPGYEFRVSETSIHTAGGSHGSLHTLDSIVPLFLAGAPSGIALPSQPRTVDVAPLCLNILGLSPERPIGASHVCS